jgi:hypothetical protein
MNIDYYMADLIKNGVTYVTFGDYKIDIHLTQSVDGRCIDLLCHTEPPEEVIEALTKIIALAVDVYAEFVEADYCVRKVPFNK